jgi:hypothetical protein
MTRAVALREDQYRTSRKAEAKAARSLNFCAAAYAVRAAASSASIRAAPSGVTSFGCSETGRSGSPSAAPMSCSFTNALLIGYVALDMSPCASAGQVRSRYSQPILKRLSQQLRERICHGWKTILSRACSIQLRFPARFQLSVTTGSEHRGSVALEFSGANAPVQTGSKARRMPAGRRD